MYIIGNLRDMEDAPKGEPIMLVLESGTHVEAEWQRVEYLGELSWEGWTYVDPLLRELCPDGPPNPTAWYSKPDEEEREVEIELEPVVIEQEVRRGDVPTERDWLEWVHSLRRGSPYQDEFERFPGTGAQAISVNDLFAQGARIIDFEPRQFGRRDRDPVRWSPEEMPTTKVSSETHYLPLLETRSGTHVLIHPNGNFDHLDRNHRGYEQGYRYDNRP